MIGGVGKKSSAATGPSLPKISCSVDLDRREVSHSARSAGEIFREAPEGVGVRLVDATHNMPPAGQDYTSPVDFASGYKKAWGLS